MSNESELKSQTKAGPPSPARLARRFQVAWTKAAARTSASAKRVTRSRLLSSQAPDRGVSFTRSLRAPATQGVPPSEVVKPLTEGQQAPRCRLSRVLPEVISRLGPRHFGGVNRHAEVV